MNNYSFPVTAVEPALAQHTLARTMKTFPFQIMQSFKVKVLISRQAPTWFVFFSLLPA